MKRIAILIDDDLLVHENTRFRLKGIHNLVIIAVFASVADALAYFEAHPEGVDVIFCDIIMPDVDGFEANRLLDGYCRLFVFLSQKLDFKDELYRTVTPVAFLRKPVDANAARALLAQLDGMETSGTAKPKQHAFIFLTENTTKDRKRVNPEDIRMINGYAKFIEFVFADGEKLTVDMPLKKAVQLLRFTGRFARISNNCVISVYSIDRVTPKLDVVMADGSVMAVARTYQKAFREFMKSNNL